MSLSVEDITKVTTRLRAAAKAHPHYAGATPPACHADVVSLSSSKNVHLIFTLDQGTACELIPKRNWHLSISETAAAGPQLASQEDIECWARAFFGDGLRLCWTGRRKESTITHVLQAADDSGRPVRGMPSGMSVPLAPWLAEAPTPFRPTDVPDMRLWLLDQWRPQGMYGANVLTELPEWRTWRRGWEEHCLRRARLWYVGEEMCSVLVGAAPILPSTTLTRDLIPDPYGLVVFAQPIEGIGSDEVRIDVWAMLWGPAVLAADPMHSLPVLCISTYSRLSSTGRLAPVGRATWPVGTNTDEYAPSEEGLSDAQEQSMAEDRRTLAALWLLSSQPGVADSVDAPVDRAARRRSQRRQVDSAVRIVHLRRQAATSQQEASQGSGRQYTHRWVVGLSSGGFWRQQAYGPKQSLRRPTWIAPYVKGPEGAPMITPKTTVKAWTK